MVGKLKIYQGYGCGPRYVTGEFRTHFYCRSRRDHLGSRHKYYGTPVPDRYNNINFKSWISNYEVSKSILPTISTPIEITMIGIISCSFNFENEDGLCKVLKNQLCQKPTPPWLGSYIDYEF